MFLAAHLKHGLHLGQVNLEIPPNPNIQQNTSYFANVHLGFHLEHTCTRILVLQFQNNTHEIGKRYND